MSKFKSAESAFEYAITSLRSETSRQYCGYQEWAGGEPMVCTAGDILNCVDTALGRSVRSRIEGFNENRTHMWNTLQIIVNHGWGPWVNVDYFDSAMVLLEKELKKRDFID